MIKLKVDGDFKNRVQQIHCGRFIVGKFIVWSIRRMVNLSQVNNSWLNSEFNHCFEDIIKS